MDKTTHNRQIDALNAISNGWTGLIGGILTNPNEGGGIIDCQIVSGEWFVIFDNDNETLMGFETRSDAIEAFRLVMVAA